MKLKWKFNDLTGEKELERINHIIIDTDERVDKALGFIEMEPSEAMFFNGYQTWTLSREYSRYDKMRGLNGMPEGNFSGSGSQSPTADSQPSSTWNRSPGSNIVLQPLRS